MNLLYTYGNEFVVEETLQDYIGYYNSEGDAYFTGMYKQKESLIILNKSQIKSYAPTSQQIGISIPLDALSPVKSLKIQTYYPTPSDNDYEVGYFTRYFAKHKLHNPVAIMEINQDEYLNIQNETEPPYILYQTVSLVWCISDMGGKVNVASSNYSILTGLEDSFRGITKYFRNLKEFSQL